MRIFLLAFGLLSACVDKEAADPGALLHEETMPRVGPASLASSRRVRCACSCDGLHITAPEGSQVTIPYDATSEAEAEILLREEESALPVRRTKSLGFIGDGPLTSLMSRGGPWNAPDALLPPHEHGGGAWEYGGGSYRGDGYTGRQGGGGYARTSVPPGVRRGYR